ncbi:GntP family permease [Marinimicrobium alkaliphilum]|uniref:GntP family permease n=1 Tax=Marinimicrobium alkaliphilum TaxID=2202654 RepID=UPI000DB9489A|nr:gluconate:H+ symporter [Marinimicrobium alkaliphilum]
MSASFLILLALLSIAALVLLIVVCKVHAFVALLLVSVGVAIAGGVPLVEIPALVQEGMGRTLGYIAVVIGIGTMIGEILRVSGGARQIANTLVRRVGEPRAPWGLTVIGLIVAIPVFFEVALILLIPLVYDLVRRTGRSMLYYGIPLVAGIAVAHSFIPPTPGPVTVAALIGADLGWVIVFGLLAGIPAAIIGGVYFGRYIGTRIHTGVPHHVPADEPVSEDGVERKVPGVGVVLAIISLPLVLILLNTAGNVWLAEGSDLRQWLSFIGHPFTALMAALLLSFYFLGTRLGFTRNEMQQVATRSMEPVGMIILLTGAGGVFGRVLVETGVGDALADMMTTTNLPIVLFAFLIAAGIRVLQGSATVSMVTAASLVAPLLAMGDYSAPLTGAVVIAIASGATVLSHFNDTGFWLVKQFMGLTERQTLLSWTIMETIIGLVGLSVILVVSLFL